VLGARSENALAVMNVRLAKAENFTASLDKF
jgi:hypothetical protein